jgi:hypothetical protein
VKKTAALLALVLSTACSSGMDMADTQSFDCNQGQDIEVRAGLDRRIGEGSFGEQFEMLVEIANNSHEDVTVTSIRVEQMADSQNAQYRFDTSYRKFDELVEEGKDETFHLPMTGRALRNMGSVTSSQPLVLVVHVLLANGDSYRCSFDVGSGR